VAATEITPPTSVRVGQTAHGRGVIATADIATGETIELCPVLELGKGDASGLLDDYVMSLGDDSDGAALVLGYGSLYNHSEEPNAEYVHEADDAYSFVALRDIAAGEEVTISYGEEWWATRDLDPGAE
jgi:SET domain-containing protein